MNFEIKNLHVNAFDKPILKGVNLTINQGQVHVIMGQNGAGKSTLASAIMGNPKYEITQGQILLDSQQLHQMAVDERAKCGVFLAMQYPQEVPGVTNSNFIKTAYNAVHNTNIGVVEFIKKMDSAVEQLQMRKDLPHRYLNDGFSGGEKKRNEILQMLILQPRLAILDEIDSGLDMDALKVVGNAIADQVQKGTAMLIITHYERILEYVKPDFVHIMADGKIVKTGGMELIEQIQQKGYDAVVGEL